MGHELPAGAKITAQSARREIIKTATDLQRHLPNIDRYVAETRAMDMETRVDDDQAALLALRAPFREVPLVQEWSRHYDAPLERYKFLVLDGESRMGKTRFAMGLVAPGRALEVNMASAPQPDLKVFEPLRHDLVLFDECDPQQVLSQKKLFQAPAAWVKLGCSATNFAAYDVYPYRVKFVISSNRWAVMCDALPAADKAWIEANSFYMCVVAPLWVQAPMA